MNRKYLFILAGLVIAAAAVLLLVSRFKYFMSEVFTWLVVIGVSYLVGWLMGRYGGKKRGADRNLSADDDD